MVHHQKGVDVMSKINVPHPGHEEHLCYMQNMDFIEANLEHYKTLVRDGKFICRRCGRVAKDADLLCYPEPL